MAFRNFWRNADPYTSRGSEYCQNITGKSEASAQACTKAIWHIQPFDIFSISAIWHIQHQCAYSKWKNTEMNAIAGINWITSSILLLNIFTHPEWWKIFFCGKVFPLHIEKKMWKGNNKIWVCFSERHVGEHYYCDFYFFL